MFESIFHFDRLFTKLIIINANGASTLRLSRNYRAKTLTHASMWFWREEHNMRPNSDWLCPGHSHFSEHFTSDEVYKKEYSMIQWHETEDINKTKNSNVSVDSNFRLTSYAWLCCVSLLHRLLCWVLSTNINVKITVLSFHIEMTGNWKE